MVPFLVWNLCSCGSWKYISSIWNYMYNEYEIWTVSLYSGWPFSWREDPLYYVNIEYCLISIYKQNSVHYFCEYRDCMYFYNLFSVIGGLVFTSVAMVIKMSKNLKQLLIVFMKNRYVCACVFCIWCCETTVERSCPILGYNIPHQLVWATIDIPTTQPPFTCVYIKQ